MISIAKKSPSKKNDPSKVRPSLISLLNLDRSKLSTDLSTFRRSLDSKARFYT